jgi:hypothetical protein
LGFGSGFAASLATGGGVESDRLRHAARARMNVVDKSHEPAREPDDVDLRRARAHTIATLAKARAASESSAAAPAFATPHPVFGFVAPELVLVGALADLATSAGPVADGCGPNGGALGVDGTVRVVVEVVALVFDTHVLYVSVPHFVLSSRSTHVPSASPS